MRERGSQAVPTYVFLCETCRGEFSVDTPWSKKSEVRCPRCGGGSLKEMFGRYTLNVISSNGSSASNGAETCACGEPGTCCAF